MNFVGMFLAFILGLLIGVLNYRISMLIISKKPDFLAVANFIHQAIAIVFLLVLYFAGPFTPFNRYYMLIGGVIGITVMIVFTTARLLKFTASAQSDNNDKNQSDVKEDASNG